MLGDTSYRRGPRSGALIVEGGLAALECATERVMTAGDHLLVMGRVTGVAYVTEAGEPLVRFRRRYLTYKL
jgi:flavin reductase (DIM6/NTAB) family NADH-FMN oxidoreductase RutF